jgi:ankyrin repeat protein
MDAATLIDIIREDEEFSEVLTESEKRILDEIEDYFIFIKKYDSDQEIPLKFVLGESSFEFISHVLTNLKTIPHTKKLLEFSMHFNKGNDRPIRTIELAKKRGYKITPDIATFLLCELCSCSIEEGARVKESVELLIKLGAEINTADQRGKGYSPLMYSFWSMSPLLTQTLISNGADPDFKNLKGETALLVACGKPPGGGITLNENSDRLDVLRILLKSGADPYLGPTPTQDAMYWAKRTKRKQTIKILSEYYVKQINKVSNDTKKVASWDDAVSKKTLDRIMYVDSNDLRLGFLTSESIDQNIKSNLYVWWKQYGEVLWFAKTKSLKSKEGVLGIEYCYEDEAYKMLYVCDNEVIENKIIETGSMLFVFNDFYSKYLSS